MDIGKNKSSKKEGKTITDEDGECKLIAEVSTLTTQQYTESSTHAETVEPINRFNYWYYWGIFKKIDSKLVAIFPAKSTYSLSWLTEERRKFYTEMQDSTEKRFKTLVALLKKHPEDIANLRVSREFNKLREYADKFKEEEIFQNYFKKVLSALAGDRRGKTTILKLKKLIQRDIDYFEKILNYRNTYSVEKAIEKVSEEVHNTSDTLWEIYKPYNKAYDMLLEVLSDSTEVIKCMRAMADNVDEGSASLDNNLILLKIYPTK